MDIDLSTGGENPMKPDVSESLGIEVPAAEDPAVADDQVLMTDDEDTDMASPMAGGGGNFGGASAEGSDAAAGEGGATWTARAAAMVASASAGAATAASYTKTKSTAFASAAAERAGAAAAYTKDKSAALASAAKERAGAAATYTKDKSKAAYTAATESAAKAATYTKEQSAAAYAAAAERAGAAATYTKEKSAALASAAKERAGAAATYTKEAGAVLVGATAAAAQKAAAASRQRFEALKAKYPEFFVGAALDELTAFQQALMDGCQGITIAAGDCVSMTVHVPSTGGTLRWSFLVRDRNIDFVVRKRQMGDVGGAVELDMVPRVRHESGNMVHGNTVLSTSATMVLVFDNSFSWMRQKHVAFKYEVLPLGTSISVRPRARPSHRTVPYPHPLTRRAARVNPRLCALSFARSIVARVRRSPQRRFAKRRRRRAAQTASPPPPQPRRRPRRLRSPSPTSAPRSRLRAARGRMPRRRSSPPPTPSSRARRGATAKRSDAPWLGVLLAVAS